MNAYRLLDDTAPAAWFDLAPGKPDRLDTLVDHAIARWPDAIALCHRGRTWTYRDLDARAAEIARLLVSLGTGPEILVAINLRRSFDMVAAILGVLRAGGAFVPLDPAYPAERLNYILRDCAAAILLVDADLPGALDFGGAIVDLRVPPAIDATGVEPARDGSPDDAAYVVYTSGSTGAPKGVVLTHSASALVTWAADTFRDGELARVAAVTSICFDPSIFEIFVPLATGGAIVLKENALEPFDADDQPTMLQGVPSIISELTRAGAIPDSVRVLNLGGEVLTAALVREIYASTRIERVFNHYGPTEATTCVAVLPVPRDVSKDPPLGDPICGTEIALLDEDRRPVPDGVVGEIAIAGPMVARGYLGQPALTARKFLADPMGRPDHRVYLTGDLARRGVSGELEFVGRIGDQIKFHGIRIELGEIEAAVSRLPGIRRAVAAVRADAQGRDRLVAYYQGDVEPDPSTFRRQLAEWLPATILPTAWLRVEDFPRTLTGKLDRAALPDPAAQQASGPSADGDDLEALIRDVCADMLDMPDFGLDDDFLAVGGDSLATIQLSLLLEERIGLAIGPLLLSHATTPRAIALAARARTQDGDGHAVVLSAVGDGAPLFGLPEVYGWPTCFVTLAREPAIARPVYGLVPGPLAAEMLRAPDLARLAASYADDIARACAGGPCVVAGYSFGGFWAHAVACDLERRGVEATLLLIDAPLNDNVRSLSWRETAALDGLGAGPLRRLLLRWFRSPGWRNAMARIRLSDLSLRWTRDGTHHLIPAWIPKEDEPLALALMRATARARPRVFGGRTVIAAARRDDRATERFDHDGMLGWRGFLRGDVRRIDTPASHQQVVRLPYVSRLAGEIGRALD